MNADQNRRAQRDSHLTIILVHVQTHFDVQDLLIGLDLYLPAIVLTQINHSV